MNSDMNDYNGSPDPGKPLEKFPERENLRVLEFGDMEFGDRRGIWGQTWNLGTWNLGTDGAFPSFNIYSRTGNVPSVPYFLPRLWN
jgi:hypothetical protein